MRKAPRVYIVMFAGGVTSVWDTPEAAEAEAARIRTMRYAKNLPVGWREFRVKSAPQSERAADVETLNALTAQANDDS